MSLQTHTETFFFHSEPSWRGDSDEMKKIMTKFCISCFIGITLRFVPPGDRACRMCEMYAVPLGHWNALIFVFANVSYETLILGGLFVSFCECLVRNAHFGRSLCQFLRMSRTKRSFWTVSLSVFANVSYETLILEVFLVRFCECLVRNAHFGRLHCPFLRMSRTKRSFWKIFLTPSKGGGPFSWPKHDQNEAF